MTTPYMTQTLCFGHPERLYFWVPWIGLPRHLKNVEEADHYKTVEAAAVRFGMELVNEIL
jgi:hypothetical protein